MAARVQLGPPPPAPALRMEMARGISQPSVAKTLPAAQVLAAVEGLVAMGHGSLEGLIVGLLRHADGPGGAAAAQGEGQGGGGGGAVGQGNSAVGLPPVSSNGKPFPVAAPGLVRPMLKPTLH